jgi:hypothetical protein
MTFNTCFKSATFDRLAISYLATARSIGGFILITRLKKEARISYFLHRHLCPQVGDTTKKYRAQ